MISTAVPAEVSDSVNARILFEYMSRNDPVSGHVVIRSADGGNPETMRPDAD